ncbi:hypothetical protein BVG19_g2414 [[Candida] boidinii]|nr:hypothetical protein BVG19_g2414 [[Candida] boidinii]OWB49105.1 hypothetical protein B5S27_g644 [[Candida] boidinii]OWB83978.1 hypothetical protein B5S33_g2614 [[Candida] boidinii]
MSKSVLIVGCGVFGLSTALELAQKGYKVTALDAYPIPSPWSAATDYNKIIRAEYADVLHTRLGVEAIHAWRTDPIFDGIYQECGRVLITPTHHQGRVEFENLGIQNLRLFGEGSRIQYFRGSEGLSNKFRAFRYNTIHEEYESKYNPEAGIAHSSNALIAVYKKCLQLGVEFIFHDKGKAVGVENDHGQGYVLTADGSKHTADQIVISSGAATGYILDLKYQQEASALFVTHIKLTPEEYKIFKDMPVLFDAELGYFFPPDPATHIFKIALPGTGASNNIPNPKGESQISLPRYKNNVPSDTMPRECVVQAKQILGKYVPELAYHDLIDCKAAWVANTSDSNFLIDRVPDFLNVFVATGDSAHGFKFLPNIGKYIVQKLEGVLDPEISALWKWRKRVNVDIKQNRYRIVSEPIDLADIEWMQESSRPRL